MSATLAFRSPQPAADRLPPQCPACDLPVAPEHRFCRSCGEKLRDVRVSDDSQLQARTFECSSCGATIEAEDDATTATCTFCGASHVTSTSVARGRARPDTVLPFQVEESAARRAVDQWRKDLGWRFLRRPEIWQAHARNLVGIYVPCWLLTAVARTRYQAEIGEEWEQSNEKRVEWFKLTGDHVARCGPALISGGTGLPQALLERIGPFDVDHGVSYRDEYVAGWRAESCSVEREEAWQAAQRKFEEVTHGRVRSFLPGDRQRKLECRVQLEDCRTDLVYVPVWTAAYQVGGTSRCVVVNGRTGRTEGEAPLCWKRTTLFVVGVLLAVGAVAAAIALGVAS